MTTSSSAPTPAKDPESPGLDGVLLVDKPRGPTSHDVVAALRKRLETRAVGHAGTLDPGATGLLVVTVGQATKLVPFLSVGDKTYVATIAFGRSTTTLDADGETTADSDVPSSLVVELESVARALANGTPVSSATAGALTRALDTERVRSEQVPPIFSAIKIDGRRAHRRARGGETVELAARAVTLRAVRVLAATPTSIDLEIVTSKGYFVRSLARDLGISLGVPSHLADLRRTTSGPFRLEDAIPLPVVQKGAPYGGPTSMATRDELIARLVPIAKVAAAVLPSATLTDEGRWHAIRGQPITPGDFASAPPTEPLAAWLSPAGSLVAIGDLGSDGRHRVRRGFYPC